MEQKRKKKDYKLLSRIDNHKIIEASTTIQVIVEEALEDKIKETKKYLRMSKTQNMNDLVYWNTEKLKNLKSILKKLDNGRLAIKLYKRWWK